LLPVIVQQKQLVDSVQQVLFWLLQSEQEMYANADCGRTK